MERYIGMDVHSQTCTLAVVDQKGRQIRKDVVETNGKVLVEYLRLIPGRKHLCLEEGTQSQWLSEILSPHVQDLAVIWPEKKPGNKNDELDALSLAEQMRAGNLAKKVFKAPESFTALRQLARCYEMVTGDVARTKNRIRGLFRSRGVSTEEIGAVRQAGCETAEKQLKQGARQVVEMLFKELEGQEAVKKGVQALLLAEARKHSAMKLLETVPGFGPVRAAQLLSVVVTPDRFRTLRQFWSYCGLGIVMRSSSDWVQAPNGGWDRSPVKKVRGLNRNFSRTAKNLMKGAATTVICQMHDNPLNADYRRLLEGGTKPNLAKLTIARKIAGAARAVWRNKEEYNPDRGRKGTK